MSVKNLLLLVLLPAALVFQGCKPEDVVTPVTPPTPVTPEPEVPGPENPSGDPSALTVCTFNIRYANTSDKYPDGSSAAWVDRCASVKKFIDATKPDIIGLQEIRKEQSQWFASTLKDYYGYYDVSRDSASGSAVSSAGGEGVGVLYRKDRFEVLIKDFFWLDTNTRERPAQNSDGTYGAWNGACRRITVYVKLKDKLHGDSIVYFFPTHYDHKSSVARKNAAELMVTQMKTLCKADNLKEADCLIVHLGDLNTTYDSAELAALNSSMNYARLSVDGPDKYASTFNGFGNSSSLIDHIYFGGKSVKPVKYWVDRSDYGVPFLSDHNPVLCQFEYN